MYRDLLGAFTGLFTERRSRVEVSVLLVTMALLPVSELLVTSLFSHLVLEGPARLEADRTAVVVAGLGFFAAFAASRAVHHVVRLNRVRVFRRGFETSATQRPRHHEAWRWAAVFELSTASVALIQVLALALLFCWVDPVLGATNLGVATGVLAALGLLYRRQLAHQVAYLAEARGAATAVDERVGRRLRDAELGAVLASAAMAGVLALVLLRAVTGATSAADAIVLFIGLRMMYGQVGHLSASAMRFARARARIAHGTPDDPGDDSGDPGDPGDDARAAADLPPAAPTDHRAQLVRQMLRSGQDGDLPAVRSYAARLAATARPRPEEDQALRAAEAFAHLAAPAQHPTALPMTWWPRPLPGTWGNWAGPLLVRQLSGHPVTYRKPGTGEPGRALLVSGSLLGSTGPASVVVGTGAPGPDVRPDPRARYVSVRGPLSAAVLSGAGGPVITAYGDPLVLAGRLLPVARAPRHDRIAVVRHVSQVGLPLVLPAGVEELGATAASPDDVRALAASLAAYAGVVTSDPGVLALCLGYELPCAPVSFGARSDLDLVLRDVVLGLGLPDPDVAAVGSAPRRDDLARLLMTSALDPSLLDTVQGHVETGVAACLETLAPT